MLVISSNSLLSAQGHGKSWGITCGNFTMGFSYMIVYFCTYVKLCGDQSVMDSL